jgi:hypothetical protein
MCFSATASFSASGVLAAIGVASIARNTTRSQRMFAGIPLIFAAQQAAEGIVWLTMNNAGQQTLHRWAVGAFLGVALVIWPMWLSLSLRLIEPHPARRRALAVTFAIGVFVSIYATISMIRLPPIATIAGHSIRYVYETSHDRGPERFLYIVVYVIPIVGPLFLSSTKLSRTIGGILTLSLIAAIVVQRDALTSVWCFFAAILSSLILISVVRGHHARAASPAPRLATAPHA